MTSPRLGIDFGTSNSTAGLYTAAGVKMVALEGAQTSLPTCLFFDMENPKQQSIFFGREAQARYRDGYEGRLLRALKSVLGSSLANEGTVIGYKAFKLMDALKLFLQEMKSKAEYAADAPIDTVVLGRPVFFVDGDSQADKEAETQLAEVAASIGFKHIRFQYEPIAAALTYEANIKKEEVVFIADLGGGTADFSIIKLRPNNALGADRSKDILGNTGVHIGGTDLDRMLSFKCLMPYLGLNSLYAQKELALPSSPYHTLSTWHKINMLYTQKSENEIADMLRHAARPKLVKRLVEVVENRKGHELIHLVEQAKIALTSAEECEMDLSSAIKDFTLGFKKIHFERAIKTQTATIEETIRQLITQSVGNADKIQTLFFTGGSSAVPRLREAISSLMPNAKIVNGDPMTAVGYGLGLEASVAA